MKHHEEPEQVIIGSTTTPISRRALLKKSAVLGFTLPSISSLLAACGDDAVDQEDDTDDAVDQDDDTADGAEQEDDTANARYGGTLVSSIPSNPPTLDIQTTSASLPAFIMYHVVEPLFTWDDEYSLAMELAESYETSDDAMNHTIYLRQGVPFHNGDELTADDVIASIERWGELSGGATVREATDEIIAVDDYTIEFHMNQPFGVLATNLGRQLEGCPIHHRDTIRGAGSQPLTEFIGTGPYEFVEHIADEHTLLRRFENYVSVDDEPDGYAGAKIAYVDEIRFVPMPDEAASVAGLRAGDLHYLREISPDQFTVLDDDPNVRVTKMRPQLSPLTNLNWESPITGDVRIRRAIQAALDHEEIAIGTTGEGFYVLQPGLFFESQVWHSTASEELYNRNDPETARELLEEAGYDGTPLRFITNGDYFYMFNSAQVITQQLEDVGFTIDLQIMDWPTQLETATDPNAWEMLATGISFRVDPITNTWLITCDAAGWWCDEEKKELIDQLWSLGDFDERYTIVERLQEKFYEDVAQIHLFDNIDIVGMSPILQGLTTPPELQHAFWNVWIEEV